MTKPATQGERIAALEAERPFNQAALDALMTRLDLMEKHMNERLDKIDGRLTAQETKLAAYENKGKGVLIGVGLFFTGTGAAIMAALAQLMGWFK